jgi:hypothetical protein
MYAGECGDTNDPYLMPPSRPAWGTPYVPDAWTNEGLLRTTKEVAGAAEHASKIAVKEYIRQEVERALPPVGAASIGLCGSFGVGGYGTACAIGGAADSQGNVVLGGLSLGGGGTTGLNVGVSGNVSWLFNATDVGQLAGPMVNAGVSAGPSPLGVVGGVDWIGSRAANDQSLHGLAVNLGVGAKDTNVVLPGEIHGGATTTGFSPWRFNVCEILQALLGG